MRIALTIVIGLGVASRHGESVSAHAVTQPTTGARAGVCEREAETLVGQKAVRIGGTIRMPKKTHNVAPNYPERPSGTTVHAGGTWIGEALVNGSGKVAQVWPIRELAFKPPLPAFNEAIVDAIRRWEYEPALLNGKPTPFCMTVSNNIHWK